MEFAPGHIVADREKLPVALHQEAEIHLGGHVDGCLRAAQQGIGQASKLGRGPGQEGMQLFSEPGLRGVSFVCGPEAFEARGEFACERLGAAECRMCGCAVKPQLGLGAQG